MRMLIKIGTALISQNNKLDYNFLKAKTREISDLYKKGNEVIIVSSGAVACGMEIESLNSRPNNTLELQLLSGEGQPKLFETYRKLFEEYGIITSQILLTHHNFDTEKERKTIRHIIESYLKKRRIPIINENDLVSKEEFESENRFSDNDILAALVSQDINADLTLILTDVDGLYSENPKNNSHSILIERVYKVNPKLKRMASDETNALGLGGMYSKVLAAEILLKRKQELIVANGNYNIEDILKGKVKRTLFKLKEK